MKSLSEDEVRGILLLNLCDDCKKESDLRGCLDVYCKPCKAKYKRVVLRRLF